MSRVVLHRGDHSPELGALIAEAWEREECLVFCPPRVRDFRTLATLPAGEVDWRGEWPDRPELPPAKGESAFPEKPVFGVFTSGTSGGVPRLVYYSRRNIEASLSSVFSLFDKDRIRQIFCYPQASHTFGLVLGYLAARRFGWELVAAPGKYSSVAHEQRLALSDPALLTLGTPAHFRDLLCYADARGVRPAPSYSAIVGGGPVTRALWLMLRDELRIEAPSIGYGATEASPGVSHLPPGVEPREDGEIGYPLAHLEIELSAEGVGFRGESLALAIAQADGLVFPRQGFLADRITARADGRWFFEGRQDAVLNRGGEKFAFEALEKTLGDALGIPALTTAIADERLHEELGIVIVAPQLDAAWLAKGTEALRATTGCRFAGARWLAIAALPLGATGKPDRAAARALLAAQSFPVLAAELGEVMPHRPPMVWIDEVVAASEEGGQCRLRYRESALYADENGPRRSSCVEFLAQAYGFVQACARRGVAKPKDAFLAAMSKIEFIDDIQVAEGDWLTITVRRIRELGPLALVEGKVQTSTGQTLATGQLKLFAQ